MIELDVDKRPIHIHHKSIAHRSAVRVQGAVQCNQQWDNKTGREKIGFCHWCTLTGCWLVLVALIRRPRRGCWHYCHIAVRPRGGNGERVFFKTLFHDFLDGLHKMKLQAFEHFGIQILVNV